MGSLIKFKIKVDPKGNGRARFRQMRHAMTDLRWAWPMVNRGIEERHRFVFDSEGGANKTFPGKWRELHPATVIARKFNMQVAGSPPFDYRMASDEGPSHKILHWSYRLRGSVTASSTFGAQYAVRVMTKKAFEFGTTRPGAHLHQNGGVEVFFGKARPVPARPFLDPLGSAAVTVAILNRELPREMMRRV